MSDASPNPSAPPPATPTPASASPDCARLVMVVTVLAIGGWMGWKWYWAQSHIRTDNAQVDSHIVPVLPHVGGFVAEVVVKEHQSVKAGDLLARIDDRDYRTRLAQAEADMALAIAGAGSSQHAGQAGTQASAARATAAAAPALP